MNVDTVRGMNMETNNRSFDDVIEEYSATWFRASIVNAEHMCPIFTEWCKTGDSISALKSLVNDINRSNTTLYASLQRMKVRITKGIEYGIIEDEKN